MKAESIPDLNLDPDPNLNSKPRPDPKKLFGIHVPVYKEAGVTTTAIFDLKVVVYMHF